MAKSGAKGISTLMAVDRDSATPVYLQIAERLRRAIETRQFQDGERLASTRALAKEWGVSRNTIVQVFDVLIAEGYLNSRVGDGTYVSRPFDEDHDDDDALCGGPPQNDAQAAYPFRALSRRGQSLARRARASEFEQPVPFMPDIPDLAEFPLRAWLRLMNEVSGRLTGRVLFDASSAGFGPLRQAIAHHLSVSRGLDCAPEQVIVTSGSQQGLDLATRLLVDRGEPVWLEEPGYVGARAALQANGCNVQSVPLDDEGLDVALGREMFLAPRLICLSPARQYPTGVIMSARRRTELLQFAAATGAWILEDDYDSEAHFEGSPPPAIRAEDAAARVVFLGTFSKTLLPSFRLGYVVAPPDLVDAFEAARGVVDRHAPILEQMALAEMMHRGLYAAHLRRMRHLYRARQAALLEVLAETLDYHPPEIERRSGMHFILPLSDEADDLAIARDLRGKGIVARPLSPYFAHRPGRQGLLLGYAAFTPEQIVEAGPRLSALRPWLASPSERCSTDVRTMRRAATSR